MPEATAMALPNKQAWATVCRYMELTCGVVLTEEQQYLLEARLGPVARRFQMSSIADYVARACRSTADVSSPHAAALIDAMTTHETLFFRDAAFWRVLEEKLLPDIARTLSGRRLRIWSAACSTGQEPYTIAMLLEEKFPQLAATAEIIATDVSEPAVAYAREGVYSTLEVNRGLGAQRLVKHFERHPGGFRLKQALRNRITWSHHNLLSPRPPPRDCHIVLCRNVLIYFNERDKQVVAKRLFEAASADGAIGVGSTEFLRATSVSPGWYLNTTRSS